MTNGSNRTCPSPETLAAFAEGRLKGAESAAIVAHLDTCDECTHDVSLAMQAAEEDNVIRPRRWAPWLAGIAAAVVIALLTPAIWTRLHRSPIDRLVALTPGTARIVEPRLTGGFRWSPYHGSERASGNPGTDPERMKLIGAAGELVERAQHDTSAEAQHDAGIAMVLTQNPAEAIARLEAAAQTEPSAQTWSDLAAARYAAASDLGRAALYPQALAATDAALRFDESLPEALFNRALILERMGLVDEARAAWTRYLAADPSSKWADEARTHLAELPAATKSSQWRRDRPLLEDAAARGDEKTLRAIVAKHAADAVAFAEAEYLGRWGEAVLRKNETEAERWLTVARAIGLEIARNRSEMLLRDAVQAIDSKPVSGRETIAAAHSAYRSGRIAYSRQKLDEAASSLQRAASLFAQSGSPMALAARYYLAGVEQQRSAGDAREELERILAEVDANSGYRSLRAHVRWETGRARLFDYDWSGAASILAESAAMFRDAGDRSSEAFVESILAYCLAAEGRGDDSWSSRIRALNALSAEGNPALLAAALGGAMRAEHLAGRNDAALALASLPQPIAGDAEQLSLVLDALQFKSMLESATGSADEALRTARRSAALAQSVTDPSLRARRLADADVATGAAMVPSNPTAAIAALTRAIDFYRRSDFPFALPEPLLLRARSALRTGGTDAAARDLEQGMEIVERHRPGASSALSTGILDADHALFSEAISLNLDRGDGATAFAIAERSLGTPVNLAEVQKRLTGSATAVVEIVALPDEIVTFAVTENDLQIRRRRKEIGTWAPLVDASLSERGTKAAATLYDELLRPVDAVIARVRNVIIVPDPRLECVPFAAAYDSSTGRYLVERVGVAIASSAGSLQRDTAHASTSVAAMTLPTGGASGTTALPQASQELTEIAASYRHTRTIPPENATVSALRDALSAADVVHLSGHTERQPNGGEHALLLTGSKEGELERTSSKAIAAMPLRHARLIVLAACETLRPPASAETHALSLGAAFTAAGVAEAIGTLAPIGDRDARTFFRTLHRHLAAGDDATNALRAAQVAAIHERKESDGPHAWRSIALLTSRIHISKG